MELQKSIGEIGLHPGGDSLSFTQNKPLIPGVVV